MMLACRPKEKTESLEDYSRYNRSSPWCPSAPVPVLGMPETLPDEAEETRPRRPAARLHSAGCAHGHVRPESSWASRRGVGGLRFDRNLIEFRQQLRVFVGLLT